MSADASDNSTDFLLVLDKIGSGEVVDEANKKLREVVEAVRDLGRAGSVVIKIDVKPIGKGNTDQLIVHGAVAAKIPKADPRSSIFFPTADGRLVRDDPNQPTLTGLRIAEPKTTKEN